MAAICQRLHNRWANCESHEKWSTDFWQFAQKNKMVNVGSSRNGCMTMGISPQSQRDKPTDVVQYATVRKVDADS
jgi:hypothetical protein